MDKEDKKHQKKKIRIYKKEIAEREKDETSARDEMEREKEMNTQQTGDGGNQSFEHLYVCPHVCARGRACARVCTCTCVCTSISILVHIHARGCVHTHVGTEM